ncbi:MAG: host specificity protein, partial [Pseudomonadota bacterium]
AIWLSASGDGFQLAAEARKPALVGSLLQDLPDGLANRWQNVSVEVALPNGALSSEERLAVLNGANLLALERASGWELLHFRSAELVGPGTYRLATLLRGVRGTETLVPKGQVGSAGTSPAGSRLVVVDDALVSVPLTEEARGLPRHFRVGPAQYGFGHPAFVSFEATFEAVGLRPFPPAHLRVRPSGDDLEITWIRQTREGGDNWQSLEVPLGEEREAYRVCVLQGETVLRAVEVSAPAFTYTAAMQIADGPASHVSVAQLSPQYGYGPDRRIPIDG